MTSPRRRRDETGANLVEYAFLVGLVAMVCLAAVTFFGGSTSGHIDRSASTIAAAG